MLAVKGTKLSDSLVLKSIPRVPAEPHVPAELTDFVVIFDGIK